MNTQNADRILENIELFDKKQLFFKNVSDIDTTINYDYRIPRFDDSVFITYNNTILDKIHRAESLINSNIISKDVKHRFIKRVINKLIKFFTRQQVEFNNANIEVQNSVNDKLNLLSTIAITQTSDLANCYKFFDSKINEMAERIIKLENEINKLKN